MNILSFSQLFDLGGLVALLGFPYIIWSSRTRRKHFDFDFEGSSGLVGEEGDNYTWTFSGAIKNRSETPNTISKIYLVVWKNSKRNSFLRFGHANMKVEDAVTSKSIPAPIYFKPREAIKVKITHTTTITSTNDKDYKILRQRIGSPKGSGFTLPKYRYELVFEDIDKNYFDQNGKIRDIDEANLWFTLGNSYRQLDDFKIYPTIKHFVKILIKKIKFSVKKLFWFLGIV